MPNTKNDAIYDSTEAIRKHYVSNGDSIIIMTKKKHTRSHTQTQMLCHYVVPGCNQTVRANNYLLFDIILIQRKNFCTNFPQFILILSAIFPTFCFRIGISSRDGFNQKPRCSRYDG